MHVLPEGSTQLSPAPLTEQDSKPIATISVLHERLPRQRIH